MDMISVEEISTLSDDQLLLNLKRCGLTFGPITATTRRLYEKRLRNYLEGNGDKTVNLSVLTDIANDSKTRASPRSKKQQSSITIEPILEQKTTSQKEPEVFKAPTPRVELERIIEPVQPKPVQKPVSVQPIQPVQPVQPKPVQNPVSVQPVQPKPQPQTIIHNLNNFNFNPNEMPLYTSTLKPNKHVSDENKPLATKTFGEDLNRFTNSPRRNPSPIKDKFAERLNNYGLLRNDIDSPAVVSSSTASSNIGLGTPSAAKFIDPALRSRLIRSDMRDSPRIEPRQPLSSRMEPKQSTTTEFQTPKKPIVAETEPKQAAQSQFNLRYLITAVIMTIIVYIIIVSLQSNPANPVEI